MDSLSLRLKRLWPMAYGLWLENKGLKRLKGLKGLKGLKRDSFLLFHKLQLWRFAGGAVEVVEQDVLRFGRREDGRLDDRFQAVDFLQGGAEGPHEFRRAEVAVGRDVASMQRPRCGYWRGLRN